MFVALNSNGLRTNAEAAQKKENYFCPMCGANMILKRGMINLAHFAHESNFDCDTFSKDMSEWHKKWQDFFDIEQREIPISFEINELEYLIAAKQNRFLDSQYIGPENESVYAAKIANLKQSQKQGTLKPYTLSHRADVLIGNYVIEFQHSPISTKEFNERNWFYTKAGYKLIWIFDFIQFFPDEYPPEDEDWEDEEDIDEIDAYDFDEDCETDETPLQKAPVVRRCRKSYNGHFYRWPHSKRFLRYLIPQKTPNIYLLFQTADFSKDNYIQNVVWVGQKHTDEGVIGDYSWFIMSDITPRNFTELFHIVNPNI